MIDKIGEHYDWKDGHDAFRTKVWKRIREMEERLAKLENADSRKDRKASKL